MASRKEQKERARAERIAGEEALAAARSRRRRLNLVGGGLIALVVVAVVVVGLASGGSNQAPRLPGRAGPPIPAQTLTALTTAAAAAGCVVHNYPNFGSGHTSATVRYQTNPPTSGSHSPLPAPDRDYVGKAVFPASMLVHSLEHGRVEIQYRAGTPQKQQRQLETLLTQPIPGHPAGFDQLLFKNPTGMPYAVAATAWQHLLGCPTFNDRVFDALRAFRAFYVNRGPESVPYPE